MVGVENSWFDFIVAKNRHIALKKARNIFEIDNLFCELQEKNTHYKNNNLNIFDIIKHLGMELIEK